VLIKLYFFFFYKNLGHSVQNLVLPLQGELMNYHR
jgi:hypothetical protein